MGLSLALAFAIGLVIFADHWAWIVLTVVVVSVGNAGRADVLYKGVQRLAGAAAGTVLALVLIAYIGGSGGRPGAVSIGTASPTDASRTLQDLVAQPGSGTIILLLAVVFAALVLRHFGYVWWALLFTLALSILQSFTSGPDGASGGFLLGERLIELALGSTLALAVAWFVLPLRSENTVRRRLGAVLAAVDARLVAPSASTDLAVADSLRDLAKVSRPFEAARRMLPRGRRPRADGWIASTRAIEELLTEPAAPATPREQRPPVGIGRRDTDDPAVPRPPGGEIRRALGETRRAIRTPDELQPALDRMLQLLCAGSPVVTPQERQHEHQDAGRQSQCGQQQEKGQQPQQHRQQMRQRQQPHPHPLDAPPSALLPTDRLDDAATNGHNGRMSLRWYAIIVDSHDIRAQAAWWAETLGWRIDHEAEDEIDIAPVGFSDNTDGASTFGLHSPGITFVPVADTKTVKNRLHIDLAPSVGDDQNGEVERLVARGATRVDVGQNSESATWVVLADPEGNEFCVLSARD